MSELFETTMVRDSPLHCAGVTKGYDGKPVLEGISIELRPGSIVGLVGRNGAGKTTLIQILLGLARPDSGSATVLAEPALAMTDASKTRLAYVPQQLPTWCRGRWVTCPRCRLGSGRSRWVVC